MSKRRTHSTIDRLPAPLRDTLTRMLCDNEWPADFQGGKGFGYNGQTESQTGSPRYEDMVEYCRQQGHVVSLSSVGRWAMRMRTIARMKQAGLITREVMKDLNNEKASQTQKAAAEMITAVAIEYVSEHESFGADEIRDVAKAMKDCAAVAINSDKYVREQISQKVKAAAAATKEKLTAAGLDRKLIQEIIDEHLGVTK